METCPDFSGTGATDSLPIFVFPRAREKNFRDLRARSSVNRVFIRSHIIGFESSLSTREIDFSQCLQAFSSCLARGRQDAQRPLQLYR